jgi:hypothetical protein
MINDKKYNGWTNYATWRIKLEMFDDSSKELYGQFKDAYDLSENLKEVANDLITDYGSNEDSLAVSYARAFLQDVNFYEIAESILEDLNESC